MSWRAYRAMDLIYGETMFASLLSTGLVLPHSGRQSAQGDVRSHLTVEAAVTHDGREDLRVDLLVAEDESVSQGQPLMRLRAAPGIALVAPMAGRVARIDLHPGHRLSQLVLFHDKGGDRHKFETKGAASRTTELRVLLQESGLWRTLRSRPFGRMPRAGETPAAIFVMAVDSKPGAPAPLTAIAGREEDFIGGLDALSRLSDAKFFLCEPQGQSFPGQVPAPVTRLSVGATHPQGLAGFVVHRHFPARADAPVWDIHAEDLADLGSLLSTGYLPETRLVAITGDALRDSALVRCQPGADLRGLSQSLVRPGPHDVLSGSILDGRPAHWLGTRERQVAVLERTSGPDARHWFVGALKRAATHAPIIPTAALDQALGGALPAAALVRALASGDTETFMQLGGLSLVEEDLALADYATGARPRLAAQLRAILTRIAVEEDAA